MKKYDKIKRLGHRSTDGILDEGKIVATEKLDGNNFRVMLHEESGELLMGSRKVQFKEDGVPDDPEEIGGQFSEVAEYVAENIDPEDLKELEEDVGSKLVLFGENMVKHTLEYDWDEVPQYLLFDAYYVDDGVYGSYENVKRIAERLGLNHAPKVGEYSGEEFKEEFDADDPSTVVPGSDWRDGKAEGIVLRNSRKQVKAKVLTEEFKEKHRSTSDGEHGEEHLPDYDTQELVNTYATDGRVRKHIKKLTVDEGKDLEMPLMEELPMRVVEDIFEEEYEELVRMNKTIDFKKFRSIVADKCVAMLKSELRKSSMEE